MKLSVTQVLCHCEATENLMFKLEALDDTCVSIDLNTVFDGLNEWSELVAKVQEALRLMGMEKAKE
jgi:hypothetical protein